MKFKIKQRGEEEIKWDTCHLVRHDKCQIKGIAGGPVIRYIDIQIYRQTRKEKKIVPDAASFSFLL